MKDKVQAFVTISVITVYLVLVLNKTASVEGFCVLATYIIKKALDLIEQNGGVK